MPIKETETKSLKDLANEYVLYTKEASVSDIKTMAVAKAYIYYLAGYSKDKHVVNLISSERKELNEILKGENPLLDLRTNASGRFSEQCFDKFFERHPEYEPLKKLKGLVELIKDEIEYIRADEEKKQIKGLSKKSADDDIIFGKFLFNRKDLVEAKKDLRGIKIEGEKLTESFKGYAAVEIFKAVTKVMKIEPDDLIQVEDFRRLSQVLKLELTSKPKTQVSDSKTRRGLVETPAMGQHGMGVTRIK